MKPFGAVCATALVIVLGQGALCLQAAQTQASRGRIDVSKLGPQVGQRVPDFILTDQDGSRQSLQSIMGPRGAMLVFFRSADW